MINFNKHIKIGALGAGTMGTGIAQVALVAGHKVVICDSNPEAQEKSLESIKNSIMKLIEKGKIEKSSGDEIISRVTFSDNLDDFAACGLVIEAIVEDLKVKQDIFAKMEEVVYENCFLATNTSSLSIGSIASACRRPERVVGLHFFNPANILPLVEIVPSLMTNRAVVEVLHGLMKEWGKAPVIAKDTPGFIVNKVARPFYGEALRIYEENIADFASIDYAMKTFGGFKMGPFELMDLIGNDVNYKVTETVFKEFYFDKRYQPSITQKRYAEANLLGRKTGRGFYDYSPDAVKPEPGIDTETASLVFERILVMLINEATDTLYRKIASRDDIDLAVTKGVNYPKGLFLWADEFGIDRVYGKLVHLSEHYREERYRPCPLLKQMIDQGRRFYE